MKYISEAYSDMSIFENSSDYSSNFTNLIVWKKAHILALQVYKVTNSFPKEEKFGLTSQIRRAVVSIPTNIVEGHAKRSDADFRRFLNISIGSATEVEYLLLLSKDLGYIDSKYYKDSSILLHEVIKMLHTLKKALEANSKK